MCNGTIRIYIRIRFDPDAYHEQLLTERTSLQQTRSRRVAIAKQ